jgi:ABC-type proline/glycine betaine transport system permease subunit
MHTFTVTVIRAFPDAVRIRYIAIARTSADLVIAAVDKFGPSAAITVLPLKVRP